MKIWNQDKYLEAWNFASSIHNGQTLPGSDIPYINHIGLVAMEATATVSHEEINHPDTLVLCALLHDSIEDTSTTYEDIKKVFGAVIADGVLALTKNTELPSKPEQMKDSLNRIKQQPKEVWMVKLCDRITNLQPPPKHWNKAKIAKYQTEATLILNELGEASPFLAERLKTKITNYSKYL
ncbi:HD domain-containing protein [Leucothrix arctica]|uniref:Bifunctional (P)ppGpp synthetase/guanosine-3',5'-bis(Diphosphate) 3'-pyrophosphohydrolase n=1 Tax=Leucothrix arctica TaxID=1481894 RepID=A0A317CBT5_9GAMM|nr:HD domain-containing protein [Leucothrix arctica]PWQ93542.1 bifunctional (p)ppGpp synthetase/guanosine-3',5'-bis(diphosphate) 3'-pyrophosphohydrolase [Leucothrix arctica]